MSPRQEAMKRTKTRRTGLIGEKIGRASSIRFCVVPAGVVVMGVLRA
jgi:hypothetical protein